MVLLPSGLRAWTCRMAAPSRQAATPCATISSGCSGRFGFASLPWMPPVRAQVMMTLSLIDTPRGRMHEEDAASACVALMIVEAPALVNQIARLLTGKPTACSISDLQHSLDVVH